MYIRFLTETLDPSVTLKDNTVSGSLLAMQKIGALGYHLLLCLPSGISDCVYGTGLISEVDAGSPAPMKGPDTKVGSFH